MDILDRIAAFVWGGGTLALILCTGAFFTLITKGFQLRHAGLIFRRTLGSLSKGRQEKSGGTSAFQAFTTALAAAMGTGNITGVATALTLGGPGAIFWMWVSAALGMMTAYSENLLGVRFRYKNAEGGYVGGPMAYMERGLKCRPMALCYALLCCLAGLGIGCMTQANSVSAALSSAYGVPPRLSGILLTIAAAAVIFGGSGRVLRTAERLVPLMSVGYMLACVALLVIFASEVPTALAEILRSAFGIKQAAGGVCGAAVRTALSAGLRRGVFSNEAGLGSSAIVHSDAECTSPPQMGMWAIVEVFADTMICCTLTALVLISSGAYADGSGRDGAAMVIEGFRQGFGSGSTVFVTAAVGIFAFATILGWSFYGEKAACYLMGRLGGRIYRTVFAAAVYIGSVGSLSAVWAVSDILNGLMALPNIAALLMLSGVVIKETKKELQGR